MREYHDHGMPTGLTYKEQEAGKTRVIDGQTCRWITNAYPGGYYDVDGSRAIKKETGETFFVGPCMGAGQFITRSRFQRTAAQNAAAGMVGIYKVIES